MKRRVRCRACGKLSLRSHLSPAGYCKGTICSFNHLREQVSQLHAHSGPLYERWKAGVKRTARRL